MPYQPKRQTPGFHKACQAKLTQAQYQWVMECAERAGLFPSEVIASLIDDQKRRDDLEESSNPKCPKCGEPADGLDSKHCQMCWEDYCSGRFWLALNGN